MSRALAKPVVLLWLSAVAGCGAGLSPAFDPRFPDRDPAALERVRVRLAQAGARPPAAPALLAATTHAAEPELLAYDLERRALRWRTPFRASARPEVLGDLVCAAGPSGLAAFEAKSGALRFRVPLEGCTFTGAASEGEWLFVTCRGSAGPGAPARSHLLAIDARSGRELWRREAAGELGRPAAAAGLVFVPWRRQSLVALDAGSGRELSRVRARDDVIEWVTPARGGVLFGWQTMHHLGETESGTALIDTSRLPGRPPLWPSGFEVEPGSRSARGRVAVHFEPELHEGGVRIARDRFYTLFYRYVFAHDATGALRFARVLEHDAIAARAVPGGLAVVSETGQVLLVPSGGGAPRVLAELGTRLASARIGGALAELAEAAPADSIAGLRRNLLEIALDPDSRLVPARAYAIEQLAELPEPDVTRDLLDIYGQSSTPPELKRVVASALRTRRHGLAHLVDALLARYDFIEQTRPAPLSVIVPALVEAGETRAVPNLVTRMFDHETPLAALPGVVRAVASLGGENAVEPLLSFLRMYRADSSFEAAPEALIEAARGVLAHGGEQAAEQLAELTRDGRATRGLSEGIAALLAPEERAKPAEKVAAAEAARAAKLPERLSDEAVDATFAEHVDGLRACIIDELGRNPKLAQVRLAFIAESDGSTHAWSFAPNTSELVDCLYAKTAPLRFPPFRSGRQVVKFVIAVRAREPAQRARVEEDAGPWWQWYARKPRAAGVAVQGEPWWHSRQPLAPLSLEAARPAPEPANPPVAERAPEKAPPPLPSAAPATPAPPAEPATEAPEDRWWEPQNP